MYHALTTPLIPFNLGIFAIFASDIYVAREIFEMIASVDCVDTSGVAHSRSGERVEWVATRRRAADLAPIH